MSIFLTKPFTRNEGENISDVLRVYRHIPCEELCRNHILDVGFYRALPESHSRFHDLRRWHVRPCSPRIGPPRQWPRSLGWSCWAPGEVMDVISDRVKKPATDVGFINGPLRIFRLCQTFHVGTRRRETTSWHLDGSTQGSSRHATWQWLLCRGWHRRVVQRLIQMKARCPYKWRPCWHSRRSSPLTSEMEEA